VAAEAGKKAPDFTPQASHGENTVELEEHTMRDPVVLEDPDGGL